MTRSEKIEQIKTVIARMRKADPIRMNEMDREHRSFGRDGYLGYKIELMDELHAMGYAQYGGNF